MFDQCKENEPPYLYDEVAKLPSVREGRDGLYMNGEKLDPLNYQRALDAAPYRLVD